MSLYKLLLLKNIVENKVHRERMAMLDCFEQLILNTDEAPDDDQPAEQNFQVPETINEEEHEESDHEQSKAKLNVLEISPKIKQKSKNVTPSGFEEENPYMII